jgi:broad specificity phosphatase PhoE
MAQVGRDAWNVSIFVSLLYLPLITVAKNHWAHLDGDGQMTWADSHHNDKGIEKVKSLGRFWSDAAENDMIPLPGTIYTSPLARTLETTRLVFANVIENHGAHFQSIVKELLRERLTDHTCDRRSTLSWIKEHYPDYIIGRGLSEDDVLWSSSCEETAEEHVTRKQRLLEDMFENDRNAFVELTTHSYAISAILEAVSMAGFRDSEGSSVAMLVKAERISSEV